MLHDARELSVGQRLVGGEAVHLLVRHRARPDPDPAERAAAVVGRGGPFGPGQLDLR